LKEEYHKWHSQFIDREFEMLVFGDSGYPIIIFPTSKGRYYQAKDFGLIDAASKYINSGKIKIYCPDSLDNESWYNESIHPAERVKNHVVYEHLIIKDVVDYAVHETGYKKVGVAGCSFGGYHAANLSFKHPDKVSYLICMSGASNVKRLLGDYYDDNVYFNNPPDYLPNLNDDWYLDKIKKTGIFLGVGDDDICLQENLVLSDILKAKNVNHLLDVRKNTGHDWKWWKKMFYDYLGKIDV
jgi:esterase/lipase superfamily enzyme